MPQLRIIESGQTSALPVEKLRYRALVIGVSSYGRSDGEGWPALACARRDAESIAVILEKLYGFQVARLLDKDATREAVLHALEEAAGLGQDDALLVYFAGHGYFDRDLGEGYWIPVDARRRNKGLPAKEDWIWNSMITRLIGSSGARHVLILADSCYSGSLLRGLASSSDAGCSPALYRRLIERPSRFAITSGDLEPVLDQAGQHSLFAYALMNQLRHADQDILAASELGYRVRKDLAPLTAQLVQAGPLAMPTHAGGEFVFRRVGGADAQDIEHALRGMVAASPTPESPGNRPLLCRSRAWSVALTGSFTAGGAAQPLRLIRDHVWSAELPVLADPSPRFQFVVEDGAGQAAWGLDGEVTATTLPLRGRSTAGAGVIASRDEMDGIYRFSFHDLTGAFEVRFARSYYDSLSPPKVTNMYIGATFNEWSTTEDAMFRVSEQVWRWEKHLSNQTNVQFKFVANASWDDVKWGDADQDDFVLPIEGQRANADRPRPRIALAQPVDGLLRITFNASSGAYQVELADGEAKPVIYDFAHLTERPD